MSNRVLIPQADFDKTTVRAGERYVFTYKHGNVFSDRINVSDIQSSVASWMVRNGNENYDVESVLFYQDRNETEVIVRVKPSIGYQQAGFPIIFFAALSIAGIAAWMMNLSLAKVERIVDNVPSESVSRLSTSALIIAGVIAAVTAQMIIKSWVKGASGS